MTASAVVLISAGSDAAADPESSRISYLGNTIQLLSSCLDCKSNQILKDLKEMI